MEGVLPDWLSLWAVQSFWWTFGFFFVAALTEMVFPPFPGEAIFFLGLITLQSAEISVVRGLVAAVLGGLAGFALLYWLGRAKGRALFIRRNRGMFSLDRLHKVEAWFKRWGALVIIFGRFLIGIRSIVPVVAGVGDYSIMRALLFGVLSMVLWNGLLATFAVVLHQNWDKFRGLWQTYNLMVWVGLGLVLLILVWRMSRRADANTNVGK